MIQEKRDYPLSMALSGGYSKLTTSAASVSGNSVGVGIQYRLGERWNVGVGWNQVLAQGFSSALYNLWTLEGGFRILGQDRATVKTVQMGSQVFAAVEERGRHALFAVGGLQQMNLSVSSGGAYSGYKIGLRYEAKFFRSFWNSFEINRSALKSTGTSATQLEFLVKIRVPVAI